MNAFSNFLSDSGGPALLLLLVAKITMLLSAAWLLHALFAHGNPRWRVLVWRTATVGVLLLSGLAAVPPFVIWAVLPPDDAATSQQARAAAAALTAFEDRMPLPQQDDMRSEPAHPYGSDFHGRFPAARVESRHRSSSRSPMELVTRPIERRQQPARTAAASVTATRLPSAAGLNNAAALRQSLIWWAVAIWFCGILLHVSRVAIGTCRIAGIRRRATDAPEWVVAESARIARDLGCGRRFAVRLTRDAASPCLIGVWRPLVLLPQPQSDQARPEEMPAILAHEIAHLRTSDLRWNSLLQTLSGMLWCHPLMWRVRAAHADACDAVADTVAAEYVGDVATYGRTLARLAVQIASPPAALGLAMARSSNVRGRIEALRRHCFVARLPRARALLLTVTGLSMLASLGGVTLTESSAAHRSGQDPSDSPAAAVPAPAADRSTLQPSDVSPNTVAGSERTTIQAVADGQPLAGVKVRLNGQIGAAGLDRTVYTDDKGIAIIEWDDPAAIKLLRMTVSKEGYVAMNYTWRSDHRAIALPRQLDLRFQRGSPIGGIVQDESAQPIAGAEVALTMPITWPLLANHVFTAASFKTDEKGRWHWPDAPADIAKVSIRASYPGYIRAGTRASKSMDNLVVLKRGLQVTGRVLDAEGKPIAGALVRFGFDRFGTSEPEDRTDEDGRFVLENCKPGQTLVTVQAEGLAPQFQDLIVVEQNKPLEFKLDAGHTLRVAVVDVNGAPIEGATFVTDTWRGYRTVEFRGKSDAQGKVEWSSAPHDAVLCDVLKSGYMAVRRMPVQASPDTQVITLHPELVIIGRVTDANTGQPIPEFRIQYGQLFSDDRVHWSRDEGVTYTDGRYSFKFDEPAQGYLLQVAAFGYKPKESRVFNTTEGEQTFDVELAPGDGPSGVVVLPDGNPAAGAEVGLATREKRASLDMGRFKRSQNSAEVVKTDDQGRFSFKPQDDEPFVLIVVHDQGFGVVTREELRQSSRIELRPWGRLRGQVLEGDQPDAQRKVTFLPEPPVLGRGGHYIWSYGYDTTTDAQGRFQFDRVIPGPGTVARVVVTEFLRTWQHSYGWQTPVVISTRGATHVKFGGIGRPVVGQVRLDREPDVAIDWQTNQPVSLDRWDSEKNRRSETFFRCLANVDASGRFCVPDVPRGSYRLTLPVNNPPSPNVCGAGAEIGRATLEFTIPEIPGGRGSEPFDLGTITATLFDTLDAGEAAPDFVAQQLGGGTVRLRDLHGKLVVMDFWATWCRPCIAEIPALKELHKQFGSDQRFALLSLSCDGEVEPARKYAQDNALGWLQAHVGATYSGVPSKYTVRSLPATFLIGPDGRVLAKNLRGDELARAVAAALADDNLFKTSGTAPAARFPVVRFEPTTNEHPLAGQPAVVVLDDSDPDFQKDRQHHDCLRLLTAAGEELWRHEGFNCCQTVGGVHGVAVDRSRERIYIRENVADRILAFDFLGRKLWQVEQIEASTLAIDDKTGHLWCSGGPRLNSGETVVLDQSGTELAAYPYCGVDMAYDPQTDAFWLVGYEIIKLRRNGELLFRKPVEGWCCASVSVNASDGSVWIGGRAHPDVARSKNRLWLLNADGSVRRTIGLGDYYPFVVECDPRNGGAWISNHLGGIRKVSPSGEVGEPLAVRASNISVNSAGEIWVTTDEAILRLNASGNVMARAQFSATSRQAWLAAF